VGVIDFPAEMPAGVGFAVVFVCLAARRGIAGLKIVRYRAKPQRRCRFVVAPEKICDSPCILFFAVRSELVVTAKNRGWNPASMRVSRLLAPVAPVTVNLAALRIDTQPLVSIARATSGGQVEILKY